MHRPLARPTARVGCTCPSTWRSRSVSWVSASLGGGTARGLRANSTIRRRVMLGVSSASPPATTGLHGGRAGGEILPRHGMSSRSAGTWPGPDQQVGPLTAPGRRRSCSQSSTAHADGPRLVCRTCRRWSSRAGRSSGWCSRPPWTTASGRAPCRCCTCHCRRESCWRRHVPPALADELGGLRDGPGHLGRARRSGSSSSSAGTRDRATSSTRTQSRWPRRSRTALPRIQPEASQCPGSHW